eukprot:scaffold19738_cov48-Phaeocystis_antarctica.AAC.1
MVKGGEIGGCGGGSTPPLSTPGWTPPRRVARPRAPRLCACNPPEEPSMCVELSQPSTTAQRAHISSPLLYHPTFEEVQLEVSRSIQPGTLAPPLVKTATKAATDLKAATDPLASGSQQVRIQFSVRRRRLAH